MAYHERHLHDLGYRLSVLFYRTKCRAKRVGLEFGLTLEWVEEQWKKQNGSCRLTGIPLEFGRAATARNPRSPSLDRIDSSRGYTTDNVELVCTWVNIAIGDFGRKVALDLASRFVERNRA